MTPVLDERHIRDITPPRLERMNWDVFADHNEVPTYVPAIKRMSNVKVVATHRGIDALLRAFANSTQVEVRLFGYTFRAYVMEVKTAVPIDGIAEATASLRVTGPVCYREDYAKRAERIARTEIARAELEAMRRSPAKFIEYCYGESPITTISKKLLAGHLHDEAERIMAEAKRRLPIGSYMGPNHEYARIVGRRLADMGFGPIKGEDASYVTKDDCDTYMKEKKMYGQKKVEFSKEAVKKNRFYVGSKRAIEANWGHDTLAKAVEHGKAQLETSDGDEQFIVKIVRVIRRKPQPVVVEEVR